MEESLDYERFSHAVDGGNSERIFEITPPVMKKCGYDSSDYTTTSVYVGEATMQINHPRQKGQTCENIEG